MPSFSRSLPLHMSAFQVVLVTHFLWCTDIWLDSICISGINWLICAEKWFPFWWVKQTFDNIKKLRSSFIFCCCCFRLNNLMFRSLDFCAFQVFWLRLMFGWRKTGERIFSKILQTCNITVRGINANMYMHSNLVQCSYKFSIKMRFSDEVFCMIIKWKWLYKKYHQKKKMAIMHARTAFHFMLMFLTLPLLWLFWLLFPHFGSANGGLKAAPKCKFRLLFLFLCLPAFVALSRLIYWQ